MHHHIVRWILEKGVCLCPDTIFYPVYVQLTSCTASYAYTGGTYLHEFKRLHYCNCNNESKEYYTSKPIYLCQTIALNVITVLIAKLSATISYLTSGFAIA